jgi:hypothetical protein
MAEAEAMPPRVVLMRADGTEPATGGEAGSSGAVASTATHNAQLSWMAAAEEEVALDDLQALLKETRSVLEKLAEGNLKLGSWQMVLWQPRWVHAETDALCYQKITSDERPIGKQKRIEFRDIREIEELENAEFVLQTGKRDYTFKAPNENKCQVFVHNLRQLRERWRVAQEANPTPAPEKKSRWGLGR